MSNTQANRKQQAKILRIVRKIHRTTGIFLFVFFIFISLTGLLLGWKKNSNGTLLPESQKGSTPHLQDWLSLDSLHQVAIRELQQISPDLPTAIKRIDVRQSKGMAKFTFKEHLWEIQLDGATGEVLQVAKRYSDLLENIHDGSVVDDQLGIPNSLFKLTYTTIMGLALLTFSLTGFWLWYGPKRLRKSRKR